VVALDNTFLDTPRIKFGRFPGMTLAGFTAVAATFLTLAVMAANGFGDKGLRLGSQAAWRFAFFVFFAALIAGPLCRLVPLGLCRHLGAQRRQLIWSFCAAFGVYLATVIVPNTFHTDMLGHEGLDAGTILFVLFSGALVSVMAYAATSHAENLLGGKVRRALLGIAATCFWLTYALTGLARITGPHRQDLFFETSVSLMVVALLLHFAERFLVKWQGRETAA
jgi:hypothetical protein